MKKLIFILSLLMTTSSLAIAGGGWTQKKNKGFFKISQWWINSGKYYNREANIVGIPKTDVFVSSFFGEYGISDKWTATAYLPLYVRTQLNEGIKNNIQVENEVLQGLGDLSFGIKYGFFQDKAIVMAVGITFGLPTGDASGGEQSLLLTGDGEFNQQLTIEASHSFYPLPIYLTGSLGFNNRTNSFSDEFLFGVESGFSWKKLTLILRLNGLNSLNNGNSEKDSYFSIYNNNREYLSYSGELVYEVSDKWGIAMATASAFRGKNILAARTYNAGIFYKLK